MSKKYYAVRVGRNIGIYDSWTDCQKETKGFSGAEFKSFSSLIEAEKWISGDINQALSNQPIKDINTLRKEEAIAFVDGSYENGCYAFGVVFITKNETNLYSQAFINNDNVKYHNVAGELEGAVFAIKHAVSNNIKSLTIVHDYAGIANWANGTWKANTTMTKGYQRFLENFRKKIDLAFIKVKSHSGNVYNDLADSLAKEALDNRYEVIVHKIL